MSDAPEKVWRSVTNTPGNPTARYFETKPDFSATIRALHPNIETVQYIRADLLRELSAAHVHTTEQRLRYLEAENARLREALEKICDRTDDVDALWVIAYDALEAE